MTDLFSRPRGCVDVRWGVALVSAVLLVGTTTAFAEPRAFDPIDMSCGDALATGCSAIGSMCTVASDGTDGTCTALMGAGSACVPDNTLVCCDDDFDCPQVGGIGSFVCTSFSGLSGGGAICTPPPIPIIYCAGAAGLELRDLIACHSIRGTPGLVSFMNGDCDDDGVSNGDEPMVGTNPCVAPPPRGVDIGDMCADLPAGCIEGDPCMHNGVDGTCVLAARMALTRCEPDDPREVLFCGGPRYVCLAGETEVAFGDGTRTFCVPALCDELDVDLVDCITDDLGFPVPFEDGDCDTDGLSNAMERDATAICISDVVPDAGVPGVDAGSPSDAGVVAPGVDSGSVAGDAGGANVDPSFEGGGGCSCRAVGDSTGPLRPAGGALFLLLVCVAGVVARRRRRRG